MFSAKQVFQMKWFPISIKLWYHFKGIVNSVARISPETKIFNCILPHFENLPNTSVNRNSQQEIISANWTTNEVQMDNTGLLLSTGSKGRNILAGLRLDSNWTCGESTNELSEHGFTRSRGCRSSKTSGNVSLAESWVMYLLVCKSFAGVRDCWSVISPLFLFNIEKCCKVAINLNFSKVTFDEKY